MGFNEASTECFLNKQVSELVGITQRQALSWTDKGLVIPYEKSMRSGIKRKYDYVNLLEFGLCNRLLEDGFGISLTKKIMDDSRALGKFRLWSEDYKAYYIKYWGGEEARKPKEVNEIHDIIGFLIYFLNRPGRRINETIEIVPWHIQETIGFYRFELGGTIIIDIGSIRKEIDGALNRIS